MTSDGRFCLFDPFLVSFRQSPPLCTIDENRSHRRAHYTSSISALCFPYVSPYQCQIEHSFLGRSNSGSHVTITVAPDRYQIEHSFLGHSNSGSDVIVTIILPSAVFSEQRYLTRSTASICSSPAVTLASDCVFQTFVLFALNLGTRWLSVIVGPDVQIFQSNN